MHGIKIRFILLSITLMILSVPIASADDSFKANMVCEGLNSTGDVSKCVVNMSDSKVDAVINTNKVEADKICSGVAGVIANYGMSLNGNWLLRIFSPNSNKNPITVCSI